MTTKRQIIQIAVTGVGENLQPALYALADDGTLWKFDAPKKGWAKMIDLPEREP